MNKIKGKMVIAQGGGPTVVINQSLVGAILQAKEYDNITSIYGAKYGVRGIIDENFLDLTNVDKNELEDVAQTPSSALCSTRDKPDEEYCKNMLKVFKAHNIRYFFYIGGNDSADTCRIINDYAKEEDYEMISIHIPKTIDNDLRVTDHCPGYGSAAKFISHAFAGVNMDNRSLPGVYIAVVMGRHAGFLTASSVLAKKYEEDGPHLIYLPEKNFTERDFIQDVNDVYKKYGRCMVAVSEGVVDAEGTPIVTKFSQEVERDSHGNVQLSGKGSLGDMLAEKVKAKLTHIDRVRADTFGYLQRSFLGVVSEVDSSEARKVGEKAVQFACEKGDSGSVVIVRKEQYSVDYELTKLKNVAKVTKNLPDEYIKNSNYVTQKFIDYALPLIGKIPVYKKLSAKSVNEKLT